MALRLSIKYTLFRIRKYYHSMMPLFRQERCTPWAPIQCHADFTSRERQHHLAQHDRSSIVIYHLNMIWPIYCGNVVKHSFCNSVRRNSDGKSFIFISTFPCWPSALKKCSQQDAQAAILVCDWSRLLNVSWQSIASSCPMGLPIKFEMWFYMTDPSTSGCNLSLNIATQGSVEQQ